MSLQLGLGQKKNEVHSATNGMVFKTITVVNVDDEDNETPAYSNGKVVIGTVPENKTVEDFVADCEAEKTSLTNKLTADLAKIDATIAQVQT